MTTVVKCIRCGASIDSSSCCLCRFDIRSEQFTSLGKIPEIDLRQISYSDWLKSKNIYFWIKDKR